MGYKIAIGGIHIESSTFTPYISNEEDFKIKRGQELLDFYPWIKDYKDVECIPLINARAIPGGPVSKVFYRQWFEEFMDLLKKSINENKIDGILLDIHGAMSVEGMMDAEGVMVSEIRKIVGDELVISTTMDLHGNISDQLFNSSDLLTCYRTAPHIDQDETKKRAFDNLISVLKQDRHKLVKAKVNIPILLPGEKTSTEVEPGKSLYASLEGLCSKAGIIDASIWMGFPWADQERCHSAIVLVGTDINIVKEASEKLALKFWDLRNEFEFVGPVASTDEAINIALRSTDHPFFISDTGDNPGAGGTGDMNLILKKLLKINNFKKIEKKILFASIFDTAAIEVLYVNKVGSTISIALGGKISVDYASPAEIKVNIESFFSDDIAGRCAVVSLDYIFMIITEKRYQYGKKEAFNKAGLKDFEDYDIIVVKMGYLEPDLSKAARGWVMALSPGAVSQDMKHITYKHLVRPLFPLEDYEFIPDLKAEVIVGR